MKNLKNIGLRALSFIALIAGSYFAVQAMHSAKVKDISKTSLASQTWYYQLNSTNPSDVNNPANYALTKPTPSISCGTGTVMCSIQDEPSTSNPSQPAFTHGNVADNELDYEANKRPPFTP
ncbi:hypothetical protein [Sphingobacterium litopenaei]|uniref:Secreted protein n=1 Tax=Sphingobacterium litopenaei TaxID=2763500 RepID=A0ABR7YB10_9SPHI|nr:hypothetical protein [Sphingobacterium litopenaei]MBD1428500.1 hypothetical protein [Sphingobacterium litopenaei]